MLTDTEIEKFKKEWQARYTGPQPKKEPKPCGCLNCPLEMGCHFICGVKPCEIGVRDISKLEIRRVVTYKNLHGHKGPRRRIETESVE